MKFTIALAVSTVFAAVASEQPQGYAMEKRGVASTRVPIYTSATSTSSRTTTSTPAPIATTTPCATPHATATPMGYGTVTADPIVTYETSAPVYNAAVGSAAVSSLASVALIASFLL